MAKFITPASASDTTKFQNASATAALSVFTAYHISGDMFLPIKEEMVLGDYVNHSRMIRKFGVDEGNLSPLTYVRWSRGSSLKEVPNSSYNSILSSREYYERIESQLLELAQSEDDDDRVEDGAIDTARSVLGQLQMHQFAPPAISWHGGDAVVMLWSLGGTTYAITATDGEVGYVVRRNRKSIKSRDSIAIEAFRLQDIR